MFPVLFIFDAPISGSHLHLRDRNTCVLLRLSAGWLRKLDGRFMLAASCLLPSVPSLRPDIRQTLTEKS